MVNGDAEELRTVVTNLLDNAVKYSGGRPQVTVHVAAPSPDTVWVRVKDQGVGIPRAQLTRIFNRFYRADPSRAETDGESGLGLAIVKALVELHGGSIQAESPGAGQGSTFTVKLPRSPVATAPASGRVGSQADLTGIRVLIVDDDDDSQALAATVREAR